MYKSAGAKFAVIVISTYVGLSIFPGFNGFAVLPLLQLVNTYQLFGTAVTLLALSAHIFCTVSHTNVHPDPANKVIVYGSCPISIQLSILPQFVMAL